MSNCCCYKYFKCEGRAEEGKGTRNCLSSLPMKICVVLGTPRRILSSGPSLAVDLEGVPGAGGRNEDGKKELRIDAGTWNRVLNNNEILPHISDSNQLGEKRARTVSPCYSISIFRSDIAPEIHRYSRAFHAVIYFKCHQVNHRFVSPSCVTHAARLGGLSASRICIFSA